jgi:hypothetical protein
MSDDISKLLRLVKELHLASKSDSIVKRLRLIQEIEFDLANSLYLLKYVLLHPLVSNNLRVFKHSLNNSLIFSETLLGECDIHVEIRECSV